MYYTLARRFQTALEEFIRRRYGVEAEVVVSRPPHLEMGALASPVCLQLAKELKRAPRQIAQEVASEIGAIEGIVRIEIAGAGYLNAFLERGAFLRNLGEEVSRKPSTPRADASKIIVEHTSINPNKAAHIGHVRNAVLGDTMARILRYVGNSVQIQNYIDDTGVQVADVVVGFLYLEKKGKSETEELIGAVVPRFDYYCWDVYARVSQWYEEDKERLKLRLQTLHDIERGGNPAAEMGKLISNAIIRRHLETMQRLGIQYDFLPQESEILHLHFWELAFEHLKRKGVLYFETEGKNKGCWAMRRPGSKPAEPESEAQRGPDEDAKVIVRSDGTVTYVGKDIAYHLWKFGLLGRDFGYRRFYRYPDGHEVWISAKSSEPGTPHFGGADAIYNVIDSRQADPQNNVIEAIRGLGYTDQAENYHHFSYEMVALTPGCAAEMGYEFSPEDAKRPYVEVSGRKGLGVKADDLLDRLEAATRAEVAQRHPDMSTAEKEATAHAIAIGAARYFLLKFTRSTIIAFDFKDALSFEGETGPYCQYAIVRVRGIRRKGAEQRSKSRALEPSAAARWLNGAEGNDFWELILLAGSLDYAVDAAVGAQEPAFVAKYAFQLAQAFNLFYHKHHILSEADPQKKAFLLLLTDLVERQLVAALSLLGIEAPEKM